MPGANDAIWDEGRWFGWADIDPRLAGDRRSETERRVRDPKADLRLVSVFEEMLDLAARYHRETGRHLNVYGDIGELFGAITCGIRLHRNHAMGSDGRVGDAFVEIKTLSPLSQNERVVVRLDRHFSHLLVVRIGADFRVSGRLIDRKRLPRRDGMMLRMKWESIGALVLAGAASEISTPAG